MAHIYNDNIDTILDQMGIHTLTLLEMDERTRPLAYHFGQLQDFLREAFEVRKEMSRVVQRKKSALVFWERKMDEVVGNFHREVLSEVGGDRHHEMYLRFFPHKLMGFTRQVRDRKVEMMEFFVNHLETRGADGMKGRHLGRLQEALAAFSNGQKEFDEVVLECEKARRREERAQMRWENVYLKLEGELSYIYEDDTMVNLFFLKSPYHQRKTKRVLADEPQMEEMAVAESEFVDMDGE